MLTKEQKQEIINHLAEAVKDQKSIAFSDFSGLTVADMRDLRSRLREKSVNYKVVKKTLLRLALSKAGLSTEEIDKIGGSVAVAMSRTDEVDPASILYEFSKENENIKILSGFLGERALSEKEVLELAKLPSQEELLGRVVGSIAAPIQNIVSVLRSPYVQLVYVLQNIKK